MMGRFQSMGDDMALLEVLAVRLGGALAKSVLKLWLGDETIGRDLGLTLVDIVDAKVPGYLDRRRTVRQFQRVADEVAERLRPMVENEFRGLAENEQEAAVRAVADVIDGAGVSATLLVRHDLDPVALERHFRAAAPPGITSLLPADGEQLYGRLLREVCNYAVEIVITLPAFGTAAAMESLRRETEIIDMVREVLDRLPARAAQSDAADEDTTFEVEYRREIARRLDSLELFGVDLSPLSSRYSLSVAYITLTASTAAQKGGAHAGGAAANGGQEAAADEQGLDYLPADQALAGASRTLVRGAAGSGKTTLLRWLAVRAARRELDGPLADWRDAVPLFIQLRRHVDGELPAPEDFLRHAADSLVGIMPRGWVHRRLASGRAMVLVDGVDELPASRWRATREWLGRLTASFPDATYVVTSRPTAAGEDWLRQADFQHCRLEPMSPSGIDEFIDHWHEAVASAVRDTPAAADLDRLRVTLKAVVRDTPTLSDLATSPLLCAMLCALNRERRTRLPKDRVELYRIALEMLVDRRDIEREISADVAAALPPRERRLLLQDFAYWLILNGYSDAERQAAVGCLARRAASMQRVTMTPEEVLDYLLLRTGLLREPVAGRVDFVHRTFQEYLAAQEIVDGDSIGLLVDHAGVDQWREVVILAAGLGNRRQVERLLTGLLDRGDRDARQRHRLHLTAVACMETATEYPAELAERLRAALDALLPPTTMTEAQALASAGTVAVPLLARYVSANARAAAACVRALTLIRGAEALDALARFRADRRVAVVRELLRSWEYFDPEEYAARVLADSPLEDGALTISEPAFLPALRRLRGLRRLECRLTDVQSLEPLRGLQPLRTLTVLMSAALTDLGPLTGLSQLSSVELYGCPSVADLTPLSTLPSLTSVTLNACERVVDLRPLTAAPSLRVLVVAQCPAADPSALRSVRGLELHLDLSLLFRLAPPSEFFEANRVHLAADWLGNDFFGELGFGELGSVGYLPGLVGALSSPDVFVRWRMADFAHGRALSATDWDRLQASLEAARRQQG